MGKIAAVRVAQGDKHNAG